MSQVLIKAPLVALLILSSKSMGKFFKDMNCRVIAHENHVIPLYPAWNSLPCDIVVNKKTSFKREELQIIRQNKEKHSNYRVKQHYRVLSCNFLCHFHVLESNHIPRKWNTFPNFCSFWNYDWLHNRVILIRCT